MLSAKEQSSALTSRRGEESGTAIPSSLTGSSFMSGMTQFLSYSLGMGTTLLALTLGMAVFKSVAATYMRRIVPYVERASAGMVTLAGIFIIYYWLTIGELGESIQDLF